MTDKKDFYVHTPEDIPAYEHWAIIEGSSVNIPASGVWAPGHGYPEHTDHYITYHAFLVKETFESELTRALEYRAKVSYASSIRGIHVQGVYQSKLRTELMEK